MNIQKAIGQAILGDDATRARVMRQITCNTSARIKCFCDCGNILDEKKVTVLEIHGAKETTLGAYCDECAPAAIDRFATQWRLIDIETRGDSKLVAVTWKMTTEIV